jgi:putative PIN family toxin of toxin-antitoxin system
MPRFVCDYIVFLRGVARGEGPACSCLTSAEQKVVELFVSGDLLAEVRDVMGRPQIRAKFPALTDALVAAFIAMVGRIAVEVAGVPAEIRLARDEKDEPYLNLAVACQAHYLVTRDKDLIEGVGDAARRRVPELQVLDPVAFLISVRQRLSAGE